MLLSSTWKRGDCRGDARDRAEQGGHPAVCRGVQNKKDFTVYDELIDPKFVNLSAPPGVPADSKGGRMWLSTFADAYPDSEFTIDEMIGEGDRVVTRKTLRGTHTGEFGGIPATGKRVTLQYVDIMRVRDGRILEHWVSMDQLSWLQQLGVMPG